MKTPIELLFNGNFNHVKFSILLDELLKNGTARFNSPDIPQIDSKSNILHIINTNSYVDFVISISELTLFDIVIPKIFVNLGVENNRATLLMFFDLDDLGKEDGKAGLNSLRSWATEFRMKFDFDSFNCKPDGGDEEDIYFNSSN